MLKRLLILLLLCFTVSGCSGGDRAGVEILSNPSAKIFINGKEAGTTPYRNKSLKSGFVQIKMVWAEASGKTWEQGIKLQPYTDTVIDVSLERDMVNGYILGLEPKENKENAGLMLATYPASAIVSIDSEVVGYAPMRITNWKEGDKHLKLMLPGYKPLDIYAKLIKGYELSLIGFLSEDREIKPVAKVEETVKNTIKIATIKKTPLGFLRVRQSSTINSPEIGRVEPNQKYEIIADVDEWVSIKVKDDLVGWVKSEFVDISQKEVQ